MANVSMSNDNLQPQNEPMTMDDAQAGRVCVPIIKKAIDEAVASGATDEQVIKACMLTVYGFIRCRATFDKAERIENFAGIAQELAMLFEAANKSN